MPARGLDVEAFGLAGSGRAIYAGLMNDILNLVLPVFCLIGLGFLLVRTGYLPDTTGDSLAAFVFKVAVPILLFQSIATASFQQTSPWIFLIVYFSAIAISWLLAMVLISKIFGRGWRASVIGGVSASFSNLVLLGIPLVERISVRTVCRFCFS